ncbi:unnamed protein product [Kluyveromyces dobzhanskii CBS 2104]|uniref:WGS project CCBQ000000000 data, contig 00104 n=1 Tax=Kluyveromyces dobzhanskii CBS 2104 TaxID=1427455 RepID=A0A0A8L5V7_9SACH|nr:unnamed protein product [Kluyveromyces dobzhanskii CBS 2104]
MDFTSSSGVLDSELSGSDSNQLSSHSDVTETEELKLIKLQEYKNNLLRQREQLLDQLSNIRVVEPRKMKLDDQLLLKLLRRGAGSLTSSHKSDDTPLPSVLPSLNVELRKKYLDITLDDITIECDKNSVLLRKEGFTATFKLEVESECIHSIAITSTAFETELEPLVRYAQDTYNVNIAMMGVMQFLRLKKLHKEMLSEIVADSKFTWASNNTISLGELEISILTYWNLPSPYPETLIETNKIQEVLDFFIYQYGIKSGIIKYGSTVI